MSSEAVVATRPEVAATSVLFRYPDPDHALAGVRLSQDVRVPGDKLDFRREDGTWSLRLDRPDVDRIEYQLVLKHSGGGTEYVCDPDNPLRSPGAFGEKSVVELPGYSRPSWLDSPVAGGTFRDLPVPTRAVGMEVATRLWAPDAPDDEPMPMLVVHDGPEYDELACLTTFLGAVIASGDIPPVRAALLGPGPRDDWYSANGAYTRALCLAVVPHLT